MYKTNISRLNDNDLVNLCRETNFNDSIIYCGVSGRYCDLYMMHNRNKFRVFDARNIELTTATQQQMYEVIGRYIEDLTVSHGGSKESNNIDLILSKCRNLKIMVWLRLNEHATHNAFHFSGLQVSKLNRLRELQLVLGVVKSSYFTNICGHLQRLQKIHIDVIDGVSNEALLQLAKNSIRLEEVFIRLNNNQVDAEHLAKLRSLKKLHLVTTEQYTKPLTTLLVDLVDNHENRLKFLAIEASTFLHGDILIVANLMKLEQLLIHCEKFEDENYGILQLCHLAVVPNLQSVYLHNIRSETKYYDILSLMFALTKVQLLSITPTAEKFAPEFYRAAKVLLIKQKDSKNSLTLGSDFGPMTAEEKALVDEEAFKIIPSQEVRRHILGDQRDYDNPEKNTDNDIHINESKPKQMKINE